MAPQSQTCNPSGQPGLFHPALSRSVDTPLGYKHPHQWHWLFSVKQPCLYHWDQERQLHAPLTTHVTQQLKFSNQPSQSLHPQPLQPYGLPAWSPGHASSLLEDMGSITPNPCTNTPGPSIWTTFAGSRRLLENLSHKLPTTLHQLPWGILADHPG